MNTDYYEILQVHPKADQEAIQAAYTRLRALYDPARLEGAADELVELAHRMRNDIERAYAVLSDPERRANYDEQTRRVEEFDPDEGEETLDYRPLPPARRRERAGDYDKRPVRATGRAAPQSINPALIVASVLLAVALVGAIVFLFVGQNPGALASAQPTAVSTVAPLDQFESDLATAKTTAQQNPQDAGALINYANLAYNSAEIVREFQPDSQLYKDRLPRWLEATQAYSQALALQPDNYAVLGDYGVSLCFYGAGTSDPSYADRGLAAVQKAIQQLPNEPRVLLSLGHCLVSVQPPRTAEALEAWLKIRESQPNTSALAQQAQLMIDLYQKK